ncbi:hypothetical protein EJB05_54091, partial [Eragrostis curvula]
MEYYANSTRNYNLSAVCDPSQSHSIFQNLTKSYNQQLNDTSSLSASLIMFVLTALFFALNLFSGLSDVSAILNPKIRVGLTSALSLFLPVMSYLFSEAKNSGGGAENPDSMAELPLRARFILFWMLLVELLRKKVEEIHMYGYSGTLERAGRVVWLGSLVFTSLQGTGRKSMMGMLWLLCAVKLVQRVCFTEFGKRSLAFGKNARLITSYMAQVLVLAENDGDHLIRADELLKRCKYAVMEEENLVVEAVPGGYRLLKGDDAGGGGAATVGKIWELAETDRVLASLDEDKRLRRLCLSFSLFKLLRRRLERLLPAMTAAETRSYRQIIFRGLLHDKDNNTVTEDEALFQVTHDELNFLSEYYHSVVPVVLASPFFLLANYFLLPVLVFALCLVVIVLCNNGSLPFAFKSIKDNNYFTFFGAAQMTRCMRQVFKNPVVFFCTVDFSITSLLFLMFMYEEVWEFFVFLLSDWFLVSLLCKYATKPLWWRNSRRTLFSWSIRCILSLRNLLHRPGISFHQFCVLKFYGLTIPAHLPLKLPILLPAATPVPKLVKHSITDYFTKLYDRDGNATNNATHLNNGRSALAGSGHTDLVPFCDSDSVAEVILTWHIATSLLEVEHGGQPAGQSNNVLQVATSLSKYCAYLVAFHPELLPGNQDSAKRVFKATKKELYGLLGFWGYYFSSSRRFRYRKINASSRSVEEAAAVATTATTVVKGATLGRILASKAAAAHSAEGVWKVLADLWVELLVYIAPSSDEECVEGHRNALAKGGEFITVLWAMATHAGISRPADGLAVPVEEIQGTMQGVSV